MNVYNKISQIDLSIQIDFLGIFQNFKYFRILMNRFPMDTSSLICHRFEFEIPRWKFVQIPSILKGESKWKLRCRFDVEDLT